VKTIVQTEIETAYKKNRQNGKFKLTLEFTIAEIVVNGNYAFARSTSKGFLVIKSSGQTIPDEHRELFVFEKVKGDWKIARYMYNKVK
jgi:ketosteroid isomerase-like protein